MSYTDLSSIKKLIKKDLLVIFVAIMFLLTVHYLWILSTGLFIKDINTPSVTTISKHRLEDSDGDTLPDRIEGTEEHPCERGEKIPFPDDYDRSAGEREFLGYCTDTDPHDSDTDNDGFPDYIEDSLGTNPTLWIDPGYIYIVWSILAGVYIYRKLTYEPSLKEYQQFEEEHSRSLSSKDKGKFAYSSSSSIEKSEDEQSSQFSAEELRDQIKQDPRYQEIMDESNKEKERQKNTLFNRIKRHPVRYLTGLLIAVLVWLFLFVL